jgi:hypothetical protein
LLTAGPAEGGHIRTHAAPVKRSQARHLALDAAASPEQVRQITGGRAVIAPILSLALAAAAANGEVVEWTPKGVSSPMFESHAAFDPLTGDLYFVRSDTSFRGWRILVSHCESEGWSPPADAPFAGDGVEADPVFTADGRSLYFISTRTTDGARRKDLDLWRVDRDAAGAWGTPVRLPEPVNSPAAEWFPRPGADGWLYFGSARPGGLGKTDIWRARETAGEWRVENLGPAVNTAGDEYEPLPSPDARRMVVMADGALYETRAAGDGGWTPRVKLGPQVNVNGSEIGALFSPTGRSLLFARDAGPGRSGEFFVLRSAPEAWPSDCPSRAPPN